ncbi:MAG: DHH family phosphoesterase, partial [Acidobacteria bacterium]|nr:DHH family phosphoesterase [Acidobacteriota bacterium]
MPSKRWNLRKHDRDAVNRLSAELNVIPLVAALLIARGYDTSDKAHTFLNPSPQHLHDPFLLMGMDAAVTRIEKSVREGEKILVWGDYDVDGTTGTVLLRKALKLLGAQTGYHVPNRFTEGYGINKPALQDAYDRGFRLVISVDTGTTSVSEVEFANSIGLDVIVTDHHLPKTGESLPPAIAIVNPNQPGCGYPDKHLAGVGVAFKLAHALLGRA